MSRRHKICSFTWNHRSLKEVLLDHNLASLGDSYVNFVCSLAMSTRRRKPLGTKVKGSVLAEALRKAGLRGYLPARMSRHTLADAAEALLVYAWLSKSVSLEESVSIIESEKDLVEGISRLLATARDSVTFP